MKTPTNNSLPNDILSALSMLDAKGTNEDITKAMTIVYAAFQWRGMHRKFSAIDLYQIAAQTGENPAQI